MIPETTDSEKCEVKNKTGDKGIVRKINNLDWLPEKKFKKIGTITMGFCRADLYMPTHVFNTADVIGKGHNEIIFHIEDGKNTLYFSYDVIAEVGKHGLNKLKLPEFVEKNVKEAEEKCKELWMYTEFIDAHQLKYMKTEEFLGHYNKLFIEIQKMFGYFNVSQPSISYAIEEEIKHLMEKQKIDGETQFNILTMMLKPDEITLLESEEKDLLKIALKIKDDRELVVFFSQEEEMVLRELFYSAKNIYDMLKAHQNKYDFLACSENFDVFDLKYYVKRLRDIVKRSEYEIYRQIAEKSPDKERMKKEREDIIKKYNLSKELVHIIDVARIYSHQRMMIRLFWSKGIHVWGKMLREFARRINISEVDIQYYTREEINNYFAKKENEKEKVSLTELEERKKPCIYAIFDRQKPILFKGEEAKLIYDKYLKDEINDKTILKGTIANKGIKVGKVKLLAHGENMVTQIYEMEKGDILVTGNTRPDMMLALEKASAVVTDEGGICSHAAIVSRELGIPCIIGTVRATKLFKDGDIIEVDANNGIVKLIR
ncbi:hypothetical protein HY636_04975 [Candidatus Woesearchaeota archaeon]|nr:hypothetical protein [Candidatus Woesearchaeota archaeon]